MEVLGLSEFMENRLIYGRDKDKLRVIQAARLLDMQLPDSVMASIVNNRDVRLHKAARFYYMLINKDDPYLFFENDKMNDRFSVWDKLEFHQLFADCHEAGKKLPSFIPLIRQLSNPEIAAFLSKRQPIGVAMSKSGTWKSISTLRIKILEKLHLKVWACVVLSPLKRR